MPDLLTPGETAELLRVSESTLKRWRREGKGPTYTRLDAGSIRYHRADLEAWLRKLTMPSVQVTVDPAVTVVNPSYAQALIQQHLGHR